MDTRTAIVTGASSGIGLALAQAYQSRHRRAVTLIQRFGLAAKRSCGSIRARRRRRADRNLFSPVRRFWRQRGLGRPMSGREFFQDSLQSGSELRELQLSHSVKSCLVNREQEHPAVFTQRFSRSRRILYLIASRVLIDAEDIYFALQNCWRTASRNPAHFEYEGAFRSWLVRVLIDEALILLEEKPPMPEPDISWRLTFYEEPLLLQKQSLNFPDCFCSDATCEHRRWSQNGRNKLAILKLGGGAR